MTTLEKNRFIGVAFLVVAFFHFATLSLGLFGFSIAYPYISNKIETVANRLTEKDLEDATKVEVVQGIPGFPGATPPRSTTAPTPQPQTKAEIEAQRTMTMIYVIGGVQFVILLFILFAGFTVLSVRAGGRSLGIVASLFLLFFYPLGTIVSICAIWFLIGDECLELYADAEKDKRAPQSII